MADPLDHNQAEPSDISTALDVEQLDLNLYRSRNLSMPFLSRGVFGGQVISQALVSATKCVKPEFTLHVSAYFLLSASVSAPLLYYVDRLRDGRTYATRSVRAVQDGRVVFVMLCSFQIPEPSQPSRHWPMPQVPRPDECKSEIETIRDLARQPDRTEESKARLMAYASAREQSPILVKVAGVLVNEPEGRRTFMYWMKAKTAQRYPAAFQKGILAYISDVHLLPVASATSGLKRSLSNGPKVLGMLSTLSHSLMFYKNDFDCGDWLLYVMTSPAAAQGRAVSSGLLYSQDGTLLAVVDQEGVLRSKVPSPDKEPSQPKAKM
ncbi:Thioesterase/thiol ester dehydrase-isomerase [Lactifluus subvellereus]|nr:Thioesterase/thiol ester dehydrase-isomerase [Lactifluus subvellereus]